MIDPSSQSRKNRGKSSEDESLFGLVNEQNKLKLAVEDMYYLLSKNYAKKSTLHLVAHHYQLKKRQILALQGMSCSQEDIRIRKEKELQSDDLQNNTVYLDGFNILIIMESALSGAYVFKGLDGCYRDISSVYGTYRRVNQTKEALIIVGKILQELKVEKVMWIFDSPVSNSGKTKKLCYEIATENNFPWEAELMYSPDKFLAKGNKIVISSDAWILNECSSWFNLFNYALKSNHITIDKSNIISSD